MLIHPIVGYIGYVGSHALEYFIVVDRSLENQYCLPRKEGDRCDKPYVNTGGLVFSALIWLLMRVSLGCCRQKHPISLTRWYFSPRGHYIFFYDNLIWKLRQPKVARSLGAENAVDHHR